MRALAEAPAQSAAPRRWADLGRRVASALVLLPVALACLWLGGAAWNALVALAAAGLAWEWRRLWRLRPGRWPLAKLAAGLLYVGLAAWSLVWLRADPIAGFGDMLFVLVIVWASDIGAYGFGRLIGGARLAAAISPGKTWSGALGGLLSAMAVGAAVTQLTAPGPLHYVAIVAGGLSVASQLGDLLESAAKRHFGVKDSGGLIPGHGGLFDRLDGLLAAAPVAALLASVVGPGVELWR